MWRLQIIKITGRTLYRNWRTILQLQREEARHNIIVLAIVYSTLLPEEARNVFTDPKDME